MKMGRAMKGNIRNHWSLWQFVAVVIFVAPGCEKISVEKTNQEERALTDIVTSMHADDFESAPDGEEKFRELTKDETMAIRTAYSRFKRAVLGYKGEEAASLLSKQSLEYYENLLKIVRIQMHDPEGYRAIEGKIAPAIRANADIILKRYSSEFIDHADARKLFISAFNQGWIGYRSLETGSIDRLRAYDRGNGRYVVGEFYNAHSLRERTLVHVGFSFEDGLWKVDLTPFFAHVEFAVNRMIAQQSLDVESSIEKTVEDSESAFQVEYWRAYTEARDEFRVKFPRAPLYAEDGDMRIYTSRHHRFGQFDVRVTDETIASGDARRAWITSMLRRLPADHPQCRSGNLGSDEFVQCDFGVSSVSGQGKVVFVFAKQRTYMLLALAPVEKYQDEVAAQFVSSFVYGKVDSP